MRERRLPLSILACSMLLAAQLSGVHMHVDAHGYAGLPSGTHVHGTADHAHDGVPGHESHSPDHRYAGDPDHDGDHDVSIVELVSGASKLSIPLAFGGLGLVIVLRAGQRVRRHAVVPRPKTRRDRWRPPLRAPPLFSLASSHCAR